MANGEQQRGTPAEFPPPVLTWELREEEVAATDSASEQPPARDAWSMPGQEPIPRSDGASGALPGEGAEAMPGPVQAWSLPLDEPAAAEGSANDEVGASRSSTQPALPPAIATWQVVGRPAEDE